MRDDLLLYYERELSYLRQAGVLFAERYPKIASRLVLEADKCEDPHVERLLEGVAFLAARVHLKIDDEFPEVTESLLNVIYPHFLRPIPSMTIVEMHLDPQAKLMTGLPVPRDSTVFSRPVNGVPCKFRTCYDTVLWPLQVTASEWRSPDRLQPPIKAGDSAAALRVEMKCIGDAELPKMGLDKLMFHLTGENALVHTLCEVLCSRLNRILVRDPSNPRLKPVTLPASALRPVGYEANEGMLPYPRRSFLGYRLLQEYFTFPEKFFFVEVSGLAKALAAGFSKSMELVFLLGEFEGEERRLRLESGINTKTFRLGCSPVVNLFPQTAEPILLNQRKYEYAVIPDIRRMAATEIFSVDEVYSVNPDRKDTTRYAPFFSFRQEDTKAEKQECFWLAARRPSARVNDEGTDIYLSMVDLSTKPVQPNADSLTIRTTCTNRDLPTRLPFGNEQGDFELEASSAVKRIIALRKPTPTLRPPLGKRALWRLISHLSLNYLSLVDEGRASLQHILKLYNFTESPVIRNMIEGITKLHSERHFARIISEHGVSFAQGTRIEIEFDEEQFVGGGVYLFASVLENFLALYTTLNSFTQLSARTRQRKEVVRTWPPRAGRKILV